MKQAERMAGGAVVGVGDDEEEGGEGDGGAGAGGAGRRKKTKRGRKAVVGKGETSSCGTTHVFGGDVVDDDDNDNDDIDVGGKIIGKRRAGIEELS